MPRIERIVIPYGPSGMPRVKATTRGGHAATYNPTTRKDAVGRRVELPYVGYKHAIREAWGDRAMMEGPLLVMIATVAARPANKVWKKRPMPAEWSIVKPDIDNVAKCVYDALNTLAFRDDAAISGAVHVKRMANGTESPFTTVVIAELQGVDVMQWLERAIPLLGVNRAENQ